MEHIIDQHQQEESVELASSPSAIVDPVERTNPLTTDNNIGGDNGSLFSYSGDDNRSLFILPSESEHSADTISESGSQKSLSSCSHIKNNKSKKAFLYVVYYFNGSYVKFGCSGNSLKATKSRYATVIGDHFIMIPFKIKYPKYMYLYEAIVKKRLNHLKYYHSFHIDVNNLEPQLKEWMDSNKDKYKLVNQLTRINTSRTRGKYYYSI